MKICYAVSIQQRNVTDRQTEGGTDRITISISRVSIVFLRIFAEGHRDEYD